MPRPARSRWQKRPSVFALLALLLTATHCIDIDDRDLEVTDGDDAGGNGGSGGSRGGSSGSGGEVCAPEEGDTECTLCTKDNCCNELSVCGASIDCENFFYCWEPCLDDICVEDCIDQYPVGAAQLDAFLTCTTDYCYDVCS